VRKESEAGASSWFRWGIGAGVLIAILLVATAVTNYWTVSRLISVQETRRELGEQVVLLEQRIRQLQATDPALIRVLIAHAKTDEIPWLEFRDGSDHVVVSRGKKLADLYTPAEQRARMRERRPTFRVRDTADGAVVVESFGILLPGGMRGGRFAVLEIAMKLQAPSSTTIWPVRRNLIIELVAAVALLLALIIMALRFRAYAKGQYLEQQVEIARQVQRDLMPASTTANAAGFDVSAECVPASEVGGDFYDVFPVGSGGAAFVVGDVSGKGLPAALLMGVLHGAVRSASWTGSAEQHQEATAQINRLLVEQAARERYASMFWGYADRKEGVLRYVNAGHPPPLLVREGRVTKLGTGGPVLGLLDDVRYEQGVAAIGPGDLLVLYSDGIVEAANAQDEEFGEERVARIVQDGANLPAAELRNRILEEVNRFAAAVEDDRTLLVIRATEQAGLEDHTREMEDVAA
jgi:hypothetical protein